MRMIDSYNAPSGGITGAPLYVNILNHNRRKENPSVP
jgi:hypothetical protein